MPIVIWPAMLELNRKLNKTRSISSCEGDKYQQKYAWNTLFLKYATVHAAECYCDDLGKIQIVAWGKAPVKRTLREWLDVISDHHLRAITSQRVIVVCFWLAINIRQNLWWNIYPIFHWLSALFMNTWATESMMSQTLNLNGKL